MLYFLIGTIIVFVIIVLFTNVYKGDNEEIFVLLISCVEVLVAIVSMYISLSAYNWWGDTKIFTEEVVTYRLEKLPISDGDSDSFVLFSEDISASSYLDVKFWNEGALMSLSVKKADIHAYVADGEPYIEVTTPKLSKWYYWFISVVPDKTMVDLYLTESDYVEYQRMLLGLE